MSNEIIESLNNCQVASPSLKTINVMKWPRALKTLTFMSETILLKKEKLEDLAELIDPENI